MKRFSSNTLRVLSFLFIAFLLGMGSCKSKATDPDYCGTSWSTQVAPQLNAVTAAAMAYASNPTTTTCNAYKAAYQGYLDALDPFVDCASWTVQQKNDLQDAIDLAQQQLSTLCK